ncbi:hypothetical protein CsSME_00049342 [Camellia sinensis var. sinensis]
MAKVVMVATRIDRNYDGGRSSVVERCDGSGSAILGNYDGSGLMAVSRLSLEFGIVVVCAIIRVCEGKWIRCCWVDHRWTGREEGLVEGRGRWW